MCANSGDNETELEGQIAGINAKLDTRERDYAEVLTSIKNLKAVLVEQGFDQLSIESNSRIKELNNEKKWLYTSIDQLNDEKKPLKARLDRLRAGSSQPALVAQPVRARTPTMVYSCGHMGTPAPSAAG